MNKLTSQTWCQFSIAEDIERNPVSPTSYKAVRWDLWGALQANYPNGGEDLKFMDIEIAKIKGIYKILFKDKWDACKGLNSYTDQNSTLVHCTPKLSALNDELDSFEQVRQIFLMLG